VHEGDFLTHARIIEQILGGEPVGAVDDDICCANEFSGVRWRDARDLCDHIEDRVESPRPFRSDDCFLATDVGSSEKHLAIQVRELDAIVIDDGEMTDTRRREIARDRRTKPTSADDQHAGG
jgi:hypothetical protein